MGDGKNVFRAWGLMSAIVSELVGLTLGGAFFGKWLDDKLQTNPWLMTIGLLFGAAAGIYGMLRIIRTHMGDES